MRQSNCSDNSCCANLENVYEKFVKLIHIIYKNGIFTWLSSHDRLIDRLLVEITGLGLRLVYHGLDYRTNSLYFHPMKSMYCHYLFPWYSIHHQNSKLYKLLVHNEFQFVLKCDSIGVTKRAFLY